MFYAILMVKYRGGGVNEVFSAKQSVEQCTIPESG